MLFSLAEYQNQARVLFREYEPYYFEMMLQKGINKGIYDGNDVA